MEAEVAYVKGGELGAGTQEDAVGDEFGTPTASLELAKIVFNRILSLPGDKFTTFDICNFYLQTPLNRPEYVRVKLSDIHDKFVQEYNLLAYTHNVWVYFEIRRGVYGLPQSGILSNKLLVALSGLGYIQAAATKLAKANLIQLLDYLSTYPDNGIL